MVVADSFSPIYYDTTDREQRDWTDRFVSPGRQTSVLSRCGVRQGLGLTLPRGYRSLHNAGCGGRVYVLSSGVSTPLHTALARDHLPTLGYFHQLYFPTATRPYTLDRRNGFHYPHICIEILVSVRHTNRTRQWPFPHSTPGCFHRLCFLTATRPYTPYHRNGGLSPSRIA